MSRTLGLDIGTNSIGWCIVEDGRKIIGMGSRIFPIGVNEDKYKDGFGKEKSKNATRQAARSIRRGYDRRRQRRRELEQLLTKAGMMFDKKVSLPTKEFYGLRRKALDHPIDLKELGRILYLLNNRRGFKSNRKDANKTGDDEKELQGMKAEMSALEKMVADSGSRTVGEYFASLFDGQPENWHNPQEPLKRIRKRHVRRKLYEEEFEALWRTQAEHYPTILTDELKKKLHDRVIFFQRKLKSAKHLVAKCRLEKDKRVMPKSHPVYQEFRIWQRIRDIRITYGNRYDEFLTNEERGLLAAELGSVEGMGIMLMKPLMSWPHSARMNDLGDKLKGNTTYARIAKAVGAEWFAHQGTEQRLALWHALHFATDESWLERFARDRFGMSNTQAADFAEVNLEPDYGSISHKAAKRVLPHLIDGNDYAEACRLAGYHHSYDEEKEGKDRTLAHRIDPNSLVSVRNPLVQMSVNETVRVVNAILNKYGPLTEVRVELLRDLKKPKTVREEIRRDQVSREKLREEHRAFLIARKLVADPGPADLKKFALWLEMEWSETDLKHLKPDVDLSDFKKFAEKVSSKDREKYHLWLECGRISPYTGATIGLNRLFSEEIHVEHIIPYSKSLDDSFANKTLAEEHVNNAKKNLTPIQYFEKFGTAEELRQFKDRVQHFSEGKRAKFLAKEVPSDFLNSQFTNSAFIGTEMRKILRTVIRDVRVTNGQLTAMLRNTWRLNELLGPKGQKNRDDHRHHALDALVIACTDQSLVQKVSTESEFDYRGRQRVPDLNFPWPMFKLDASAQLNSMLVSYRTGKRLLSAKTNEYRYSKPKNGLKPTPQKTLAVRGSLHEGTVYGQITLDQKTGEQSYVLRRGLDWFADPTRFKKVELLKGVVDKAVREALQAHVARFDGNMREAFKVPVYLPRKTHGNPVRITSARTKVSGENMRELRPGAFVEPGNNYCIAIYENDKGKRTPRTVTFYDAVKLTLQGKELYPVQVEDKPFLMTLQQRDMVVVYDEHPDQIQWDSPEWMMTHLYKVLSFDRKGEFRLTLHKAANADTNSTADRQRGLAIRCALGSLKAVKVEVDVLGTIRRPK